MRHTTGSDKQAQEQEQEHHHRNTNRSLFARSEQKTKECAASDGTGGVAIFVQCYTVAVGVPLLPLNDARVVWVVCIFAMLHILYTHITYYSTDNECMHL